MLKDKNISVTSSTNPVSRESVKATWACLDAQLLVKYRWGQGQPLPGLPLLNASWMQADTLV